MNNYDTIYQANNTLNSDLKIEVRRIDSNGDYEPQWHNIEDLIANQTIVHNSIPSLSYKFPSEEFSYGVLRVPDCTLKLLSINGEFSSQSNASSIFNNYVRHRSLIRISHGYQDPKDEVYNYIEVYRGFINEISVKTKVSNDNTYQDLFIEDLLTFLLKDYTFSNFNITSTVLSDFLLELFDRTEFTEFLTVDMGNILPGYNIQNIDNSNIEGQTQWLKVLQDLSTGHSYLFQRAGTLYYRASDAIFPPPSANLFENYIFQDGDNYLFQDGESFEFNEVRTAQIGEDKIIKFNGFNNGISQVFEKLFWKDSAASFSAPTNLFNKSKTFNIESITDISDQTNVLSEIGTRISRARARFKITIVLYVNISILTGIKISAGDYVIDGGLIWDLGNWDEENWSATVGASFSLSSSTLVVKEITHNFQSGTTDLLVEQI